MAIFAFTLSGGLNFTKADEITTITLNGEFSDWKDVPTLLTNVETWYPDFLDKGATYYWNNERDGWQTEPIDNTCMYNEGRALDLGTIKFANDSNYLYFYWEKNSDYMNYFWKTFPNDPNNNTIDEQGFTSTPVTRYSDVAQSDPPCLGETIYNPTTYDHDMVYAFDTNLDMKNDYYLVMNVIAPIGTSGSDYQYSVTSYIYKDNGNGVYDTRGTEILLSELGSEYEQWPSNVACQNGVCQEGRIKINTFFTDLGLKWGSAVLVNYEAHSPTKLYGTAKSIYSFNKNNKLGLKITFPKKLRTTTKSKATLLSGKVKKGSKITIYVNGKKKQSFTAGAAKFTKKVSLKKGNNVVIVKAKLGKKKVTKGVLIKRTK